MKAKNATVREDDNTHVSEGRRPKWLFFCGAPSVPVAVMICAQSQLEQCVGQKALPYVASGIAILIYVVGMITYNHFPKRQINRVGIIGWILTFGILFWYFGIGPGAL